MNAESPENNFINFIFTELLVVLIISLIVSIILFIKNIIKVIGTLTSHFIVFRTVNDHCFGLFARKRQPITRECGLDNTKAAY